MSEIAFYDIAKSLVANEKPMDPIMFNQSIIAIANDKDICYSNYIMLLCNERRDFSIFHCPELGTKAFASALAETLSNRGDVIFIDKQEDGAYEIWIRDKETKQNFAYFLFDYDNGIIEV